MLISCISHVHDVYLCPCWIISDGKASRYILDVARLFPPVPRSCTPHPRKCVATVLPLDDSQPTVDRPVADYMGFVMETTGISGSGTLYKSPCSDGVMFHMPPTPVS